MNTKVWYLPYFKGVYHTQILETYLNANARMVLTVPSTELRVKYSIVSCRTLL